MLSHSYRNLLLRSAVLLAAGSTPTFVQSAAATPLPNAPSREVGPFQTANVPVSGRVTQSNGEGLPGVTVVVKGSSQGTSTDASGNFSLEVPEGSTLVFSYVGYTRREVPVTGASTSFNVTLSEDTQALKEVVVVGYGTQERTSVTGSVASVSAKEIAAQPVADAAQALQGRAAGVQIVSNSGAPGGAGGTSVRVRGITSAGNNSPLYVVDGFPLPTAVDGNGNATGTELSTINPNDIESIDVLKDASATAIYGVRAANGVVLITTKRGKAGTANINLDAYVGTQNVWRQIPMLNATQFAQLNNEARTAGGLAIIPKYADPASLGKGTNWLDEIFRPAKIQNYAISATGGSEKARYAVSAGYFQQDGTIINSNFQRFTLRANGEVQLSKILKIGNTLALTHQDERPLNNENNEFSGVIQLAVQAPPVAPARNPDGSFYEFSSLDNYGEENPVTAALRPIIKNNRNRATSTFYAELEPLTGLRFRTNIGADLQFLQQDQFFPSIVGSSKYPASQSSASSSSNYSPSYLIENTATYDKIIGNKHQFTFLLGQSSQQFDNFYLTATRVGYSRNDLQIIDRGPINAQINNGGNNSRSRLASYFGRINYEFAGKYLFSATARYDGSSAFAPGNQFGFFPGISAGWRLSEEDFLKSYSSISNLKIRAGYGKVGNPLNAGSFAFLATINSSALSNNGVPGTGYVFGTGSQNQVIGGAPTRLQNPDLQWENNEQYNIGIDLGLWQNRVSASVDLYKRTSPNLIAAVPVSYVSGTSESINTNAASSSNRGIDLAITTNNLVSDNGLNWTTTLNFSLYRNKVTSLGAGRPYFGQGIRANNYLVRYAAGIPFGSFYGYVADGIIQTTEELTALNAGSSTGFYQQSGTAPGDIKYKDINGDGVINSQDQAYIGNPNPDFTYGLNNTLSFRGLDLNIFLQGSQGNDVYNLNRYYTEGGLFGASNASTIALDRWTGPGTSNYVPRAVAGDPNNNLRVSSHYVENGSYMRIKLLTLGYTLPTTLLGRVHAQRIRVYVTSQNLLTITKYKGFDPELGNQGGSLGVDRGIYPQSRVFLAGVNIGF
ncbi:SusC/RagA family TonB-linked outer membrane protein [Hymenobacter jejuensis]|uniref:TonB-dependent receptor n=1 Tax=Hymenobacter jejuensis TaxID=2502781 RepID=A0A5B8A5S3_9BACT|nr:TonB-dependent receptor [Hymenobacter jejuensis]QDA61572.1 TonB-dependent receptor [Hymenobacter jejuensis]